MSLMQFKSFENSTSKKQKEKERVQDINIISTKTKNNN